MSDYIIDLENNTVTRYITNYNTRYVTNYDYNTVYNTKYIRVATAVIVNYLLNGQVITTLTFPTRIVLGETTAVGSQTVQSTSSSSKKRSWKRSSQGGGKRRVYVPA